MAAASRFIVRGGVRLRVNERGGINEIPKGVCSCRSQTRNRSADHAPVNARRWLSLKVKRSESERERTSGRELLRLSPAEERRQAGVVRVHCPPSQYICIKRTALSPFISGNYSRANTPSGKVECELVNI